MEPINPARYRAAMKRLQHDIKERLSNLDNETYCEAMREISMWADDEANIAEYANDTVWPLPDDME